MLPKAFALISQFCIQVLEQPYNDQMHLFRIKINFKHLPVESLHLFLESFSQQI